MSEVTIVEVRDPSITRSAKIAIRPYVDNNIDNMGLQNYSQVLFDGVWHEEQLACIEFNGVKRYLTGLDEFAPSIKKIPDQVQREAKQREIRLLVSQLEKELASNVIDPDDKDFWNQVKLLRPDNDSFWGKIVIKCTNEPTFLDPNNPHDLIKIRAIDDGGFSIIARSYEEAKRSGGKKKFYLDRFDETVGVKTEVKKTKNKAISVLQDIFDTNVNKLFYMAKVLDTNSAQYKKSTPNDIIYDNMDKFINGEGFERSALKASKMFLDLSKQDLSDIKLRAVAKDMLYYKVGYAKADGFIYHKGTNTILGRTIADVVEFLNNPANDDLSRDIIDKVQVFWNK